MRVLGQTRVHGYGRGAKSLRNICHLSQCHHSIRYTDAVTKRRLEDPPRSLPPQQMHLPGEDERVLALDSSMPLIGKRVLVTAPRQYATKLCSKLLSAGARPLWTPGVAITALSAQNHQQELEQLDRELRSLTSKSHGYTHIAFTSKNGIHGVIQRLAHIIDGSLDDACQVLHDCGAQLCALGADGQVLMQAGLPVHVSPKEASTQGLVKELVARGEAQGARVLCPVPLVTGGLTEPPVVPRFLSALEAAGATAVRLPAYVTSMGATPASCETERHLLESGHVNAIAFSSTAEAQGLVHLMGGLDSLRHAITQHQVLLAAHGPYTAAGASQVLGLPVTCISNSFSTFDGLVAALESAFANTELHTHTAAGIETHKAEANGHVLVQAGGR